MKHTKYEANLEGVLEKNIFLNVNLLKKGTYKLNIVHKKKIIKSIHFTKE
ncbi:hypothetical protein [Xanthomarina sp. GH4-25]